MPDQGQTLVQLLRSTRSPLGDHLQRVFRQVEHFAGLRCVRQLLLVVRGARTAGIAVAVHIGSGRWFLDELKQSAHAQEFVFLGTDVLVGEPTQNVFAELDLLDDRGSGRSMVLCLVGVDDDLPVIDDLGLRHVDEEQFTPRFLEQQLLVMNGPAEAQSLDELNDGERDLRCGFGQLLDRFGRMDFDWRRWRWRRHWVGGH